MENILVTTKFYSVLRHIEQYAFMYNFMGYFMCTPVPIISIPSMGAFKPHKLKDYPVFISPLN